MPPLLKSTTERNLILATYIHSAARCMCIITCQSGTDLSHELTKEEWLSSDNILLDHWKEDDSGHVSLNIIIKWLARLSPNMHHLFLNCNVFGSSAWSIEQSLCTGSNTEGGRVKVDPHPLQYSKQPVNIGGTLEVSVEQRYLGCCNHDLLVMISTHSR